MSTPTLRRNRDFVLLQLSQLVSSGGSQLTAVAYPLLVLSLTGSSAKAGLVAFARLLPVALLSLPAGVAADRWNRRWLMMAAHVLRALAVGALAVLVATERAVFWEIPVVAFVEGCGAALYAAAQGGALRAVVPREQLPAAVNVVTGREAALRLSTPAIGGALFGIARALPFLIHAASYVVSTALLLAMRTPFQEVRDDEHASVRTQLREGVRFLWNQPFLRTMAFLFGLANFLGPMLAIVVIGQKTVSPEVRSGCSCPSSVGQSSLGRSSRRSCGSGFQSARSSCSSSGPGPAAACSSSGRACTSWPRALCRPASPSRRPTRSFAASSSP